MSSKVAEFRALKAAIAEQLAQLESLKNNEGLKRDIEFEQKLRALMEEYGVSLRGIIALLDPQAPAKVVKKAGKRQHSLKTYKNPHTGEIVEAKSGNNKVLKAWKEKHSAAVVDGWLQS